MRKGHDGQAGQSSSLAYMKPVPATRRQRPGAAGFEDGTPAYLGISALKHGFAQIERFGSFLAIERHTASLTRYGSVEVSEESTASLGLCMPYSYPEAILQPNSALADNL